MSNPAPSARYDLPWKAVVAHAFHPFMDFYFPAFSARIDWQHRPRFRDKELAGIGIANAGPLSYAADSSGSGQTLCGQAAFDTVTVQASLEAKAHNRVIQRDQLDDDLARAT